MKKDCVGFASIKYGFHIFCLAAVFFGLPAVSSAQVIGGGSLHSIAICSDNKAWGWGRNVAGQIGDGTSGGPRLTPVQTIVLTGVTAVSGRKTNSLFLKNDGTAWACGDNTLGQLGDGTSTSPRLTSVQVTGLTGITAVAGANNHSLFLKNDATVWACGVNGFGQLGDGTSTQRLTAVQAIVLTGITSISVGGEHSLFLRSDATAWASGYNANGRLGDGTSTNRYTAVQVSGLTGVTAIAGGDFNSLFLKNDGTVWGCGANNSGQLGDGTTTERLTVVQATGLTGITAIATNSGHSLFLKNDNTVWACGSNTNGQLGDATTTNRLTAVEVSGITGVTAIAAGAYHSLFVKSNGSVWACGWNIAGALGDGTSTNSNTPVQTVMFGTPPSGCIVVPLPVELLSFTANPFQNNSVLCNWATATEMNNDYFTLEKAPSTLLTSGSFNWVPFANIAGAGNSSTTLNYQYIDPDPFMGLSYYRLKQTDYNGSFSYSDIRSVYFGGIDLISIYPNPSSDYIIYTVASENGGPATLKLYDALGKAVFSKAEIMEKGITTKQLSTSTLSSGIYLLRITTKLQEKVQKQFMIKQ